MKDREMSFRFAPAYPPSRDLLEGDAATIATNLNAMRVTWVDFRRGTINSSTLRLLLDRNVDAIVRVAKLYE